MLLFLIVVTNLTIYYLAETSRKFIFNSILKGFLNVILEHIFTLVNVLLFAQIIDVIITTVKGDK